MPWSPLFAVVPAALFVSFWATLASAYQPAQSAGECMVTIRNGQGVEGFPTNHRDGDLAVWIPPDGKFTFQPQGPGFTLPDGSMSLKWGWFRFVPGRLVIEGRRVDAPAPPLRARISGGYTDRGFQPTSLIFPTPGCWEITGRVGQATLTFVVQIEKVGPGPPLQSDPL
jgi:hypothetical protein